MEETAPTERHLVITVHGIRTFGQWQERLEQLLRTSGTTQSQLTVVHYKFGYFSAFAFLSIVLRWLAVRRLRTELLALTRAQWSRIDVVAHSFGTFIAVKALASLASESKIHVDTLILAGSVLPDYFRWNKLVPNRVGTVVNECGTKDNVLLLSQALPLLGMAGRTGFRGITSRYLRNRFFRFGHSGYFLKQGKPYDDFMREYWLPILLYGEEARPVDQRPANVLAGVEAFLLNNSRPLKLLAYVVLASLLIVGGIPWAASIYAGKLVSKEDGYITKSVDGTKVWFDEGADPRLAIRWLGAVGPIHELDLEKTKVNDTDVEALPRDEKLAILKLGDTAMTKRALPSLARFHGLKQLTLFDDSLGSLDEFPQWSGLETLDLDGTGVSDNDLVHLAGLVTIRQLDLSNNRIEGTGLRYLDHLANLTELDLDDEQLLTDQSLRSLSSLKSLTTLSLSGTHISGEGLVYLRDLKELRSLDLAYTNVTDAGLLRLPMLPKLREVMLTGANISGKGLAAVAQFDSLEELWLKDTQVNNAGLIQLAPLRHLRILALPDTKIGPGALWSLRGLLSLEELYLGNVAITDEDLNQLRSLPKLRLVFLPQNPQITDKGLLELRNLPQLRELNIERTGTSQEARDQFRKVRPDVKLEF